MKRTLPYNRKFIMNGDAENMISQVGPHIPNYGPGPGRHKQALTKPLGPNRKPTEQAAG